MFKHFLLIFLVLAGLAGCGGGDSQTGDDGGNDNGGIDDPDDGIPPPVAGGRYFEHDMPWQREIANDALHPDSAGVISYLASRDDADSLFPETDGVMQIDFTSFHILHADTSTRQLRYDENHEMAYGEWYGDPPCDNLIDLPVPESGRIEGVENFQCAESLDEDCHLIVHDTETKLLYELYHASVFDDGAETVGALCPVVWDLEHAYGETLRGQNCTSADAAGLPIAPLLVTADEVAKGEIEHALRFILRNDVIREGFHVPPATHSGNPSADSPFAPIYGMRFRLRADYPVETLPPAGQVIARALQTYGMILVDGGNVAFNFLADDLSDHKWSEFDGFGPYMFKDVLDITDFEIIATGDTVVSTQDCELGVERSDKVRVLLKH